MNASTAKENCNITWPLIKEHSNWIVDDIFAILVANSKPEFDIKAICSVSGNVGIDLTTHNAQLIVGLLGLDCIVAKGAEKPLIKDVLPATDVHGSDGFGGYANTFGDDKLSKLSNLSVIEVERKILMESDEPAYIVFNSGVKLMMCGLNVTLKATLTNIELNEMSEFHNTISDIGVKILSSYIDTDAAIHDPCAILAITDSDMFEYKDQYIQIDIRSGITQGMSYVDESHNPDKKSNCRVFYDINKEFFRKAIVKSVKI